MKLRHFIILFPFLIILSCNLPLEENEWEKLGLEGKSICRMVKIDNKLYVSVSNEGLYVQDVSQSDTSWDFIGFPDTSFINMSYISDIISVNDELLISLVSVIPNYPHVIFRSSDGGQSWTGSDNGIVTMSEIANGCYVHGLKQYPQSPETILAQTSSSFVYKSVDEGRNWSLFCGSSGVVEPVNRIDINQNDPDEIWIGGQGYNFPPFLLHTTDNGETWSDTIRFPTERVSETDYLRDLVIHPNNSGGVYFIVNDIYKTTDDGNTFETMSDWSDNFGYCFRLEFNPDNPREIFVKGDCIYYSRDNGRTWISISTPAGCSDFGAWLIDWPERTLYASTACWYYAVYKIGF